VLEVGIGSGLNLPHYDAGKVSAVLGLDPSPQLVAMSRRAAEKAPFEVELLEAAAEEIPLASESLDTVLVTYTLCSIPGVEQALAEMRRVLKPGGRLVFCEHGAAPDASVRRWQERITPLWKRLAGGCHLNREIPRLIARAGFRIATMESMYLPGWRPATFNYWGTAEPA
jgi:ubiquinone/menaquinone biosynthesis C-methylase UbiE